ncbi:MAG: FlgD immunoglobulin-like domain containing protein, partial [candidate division KSB1 bacterium]|nr:FlgD immunoglobulin-like domain containing protein [candidate division KSB1 bacterium]
AVLRNATLQVVSTAPATSVEQEMAPVPERFTVYPNYPNPFNPGTQIRFALPQPAKVEAVVYDLSGRRVKTLLNGLVRAGWHSVTWDGTNALGHRVASGVYLYTIRAGAEVVTGKMTLVQ